VNPTSSPSSWDSDWFKLEGVESLPVKGFAAKPHPSFPIPPPETVKKLSQDQQLFFELCLAIINGVMTDRLSKRTIGVLNHSRWLTTASRVLRLFASFDAEECPPDLDKLVHYIIYCYAPLWFAHRKNPLAITTPQVNSMIRGTLNG
jgi:hypothetical protein